MPIRGNILAKDVKNVKLMPEKENRHLTVWNSMLLINGGPSMIGVLW